MILRREALEQTLEEKENIIQKFKENSKSTEKNQELYQKVKQLKEKLEKSRQSTEEVKQFFLLKSEKDDKYIEMLKLEIERLNAAINKDVISNNNVKGGKNSSKN